jgi:hypothetical protein
LFCVVAFVLVSCGRSATNQSAAVEPFADITQESGIAFVHSNSMSGEYYLPEITGSGVALLDYDNDGRLDILVLQGAPLRAGEPDHLSKEQCTARLYHNDLTVSSDGTRSVKFTDTTAESGLCSHGYGMGIATGDFNNDGCVDVFITHFGSPNQLFRNNCNGTFTDVTESAGVGGNGRWGMSASFFDYDRDGFLDIFVTNYVDFDLRTNPKCLNSMGARDWCTPAAFPAVPGILYRNRGDGTFEDVSARSGITRTFGAGMGVVTADFNGDGWPDILVANDMGANQLWINQRNGTFRDEAALRGVAVNADGAPESNMGVDFADYNNDGLDDLIITHIVGEKATLFVNVGQGQFEDRSSMVGLRATTSRYTGFGVAFMDYDNDSWLDLVIANGAVRRQSEQNDALPLRQPKQLLHNLGNGRFADTTSASARAFAPLEVGRGLAIGDIDNDGAMDFVVSNNNGPLRIVLNKSGVAKANAWIGLRLCIGKRDALGARVEVSRRDAPPLWRRVHTDGSYLSASDPRLLIGLGVNAIVESVVVHWPDGFQERFPAPPLRRYTTLAQHTGREVGRTQ